MKKIVVLFLLNFLTGMHAYAFDLTYEAASGAD